MPTAIQQEQALEPEGVQQEERRGLIDGVVMSDVMESTVSALHTLSSTSMVFRDSIDDLGVRPLLRRLLSEGQLEYDVDTAARNLLESLGGGIADPEGPVTPPRSASLRQQQQQGHSLIDVAILGLNIEGFIFQYIPFGIRDELQHALCSNSISTRTALLHYLRPPLHAVMNLQHH